MVWFSIERAIVGTSSTYCIPFSEHLFISGLDCIDGNFPICLLGGECVCVEFTDSHGLIS